MSSWSENIAQINQIIEKLRKDLTPYLDINSKKEKQAQLKSIEKSIVQLENSGHSIPNELRQLKLKLLSELDRFREAEEASEKLISIISEYVPSKKNKLIKSTKRIIKRPRKNQIPTVEIIDLLECNLITPGTKLQRLYKGSHKEAEINDKGKIRLLNSPITEEFDTPSAAAVAASGKSKNGWVWWRVSVDGKLLPLNVFRQKFLEQHK